MIDSLIIEFDKGLRTLFAPAQTLRARPGSKVDETVMTEEQRQHAAALMRINHCGEVCAQALYQGQALTSRTLQLKQALAEAAREETEHLNWTETRIQELGGRKSLLNPLWYTGSLAIGIAAGKLGDDWNLGFLAETERQVGAHLEGHLQRLPEEDQRSRQILEQMKEDEASHADLALRLGARELPTPVKLGMKLISKVMTRTAYWV